MTAGTPNYMAPELFLAKAYSTPVDVFAFGVLLNELWACEVPWDGYAPLDIKAKVVAGGRPPVPRTMPFACEGLLKKAWHATPSLRPSFSELLPALHGVHDSLPPIGRSARSFGSGSAAGGGMPPDCLDSLDALAGLSLAPRRR